MHESQIEGFWQHNPCGEHFVGGVDKYGGQYETFFTTYDQFRYSKESHILKCLDAINFSGKHTLEVGLGLGADSEQLIRRGAVWSGLDLTSESLERVRARLMLRVLPFTTLKQGSVLEMPFRDRSFDIIYSHGVLHHVPEIRRAEHELWRVLKPDGELIVMLYAKWSLNYLLSISLVRRLGLLGLYLSGYNPGGIYGEHLKNARAMGLFGYLSRTNWIHRNTDGPQNPFTRVSDLRTVRRDFPSFRIVRAYKQHMHAPPLPVSRLPFQRALGWHLWVHMKPLGTPVR